MFKVLTDGCEPQRGTKYSACADLFASEDMVIGAGETKLVGLGVAIDSVKLEEIANHAREIEMLQYPHLKGYKYDYLDAMKKANYLQLMLRSSLGKKGLILPNGVGIIDLDYQDEIKMIIHNSGKQEAQSIDLVIGNIYETAGSGKCQYKGIDNYMGQNTYQFTKLEYGGDRFIGLDDLDSFLNIKNDSFTIKKGERIAQITLLEHKGYLMGVDTEDERKGGFGSTGK